MKKYRVITNLFRDFDRGDIIEKFGEYYYKGNGPPFLDEKYLPRKFIENYPEYFKEITKETTFKKELASLINRYSRENNSNTPDFILALYLDDALKLFEYAINRGEQWHDNTKA